MLRSSVIASLYFSAKLSFFSLKIFSASFSLQIAVHTEQIVRDITGSILCSYQIAHKYGLTKMTVDSIARIHLGEEIYQKKEHLTLEHLKGEFLKLKSQGLSIHNIWIKLGLSKANSFNLARRFEGEGCDSCDDDVIQIESIPQFCDTQIEVKSQVTVSAPAVTPEARAHSSCKETSEDAVSVVPSKPKEKNLQKERVLGYQT